MKFSFNQYYRFLIGRRWGEQKDTNTTKELLTTNNTVTV